MNKGGHEVVNQTYRPFSTSKIDFDDFRPLRLGSFSSVFEIAKHKKFIWVNIINLFQLKENF